MTHLHGNHQARRAALEAARADDSDVWYAPVRTRPRRTMHQPD